MSKPPVELLAAFQASEEVQSIAVLMVEEGFDADVMRVLAAWQQSHHEWTQPKRACPDHGRPTARAYAWLVSGWEIDSEAIARAADVSPSVARAKIDVLIGSRLIYPDGTMAKAAQAALRSHVSARLQAGGGRKRKPAPADAN